MTQADQTNAEVASHETSVAVWDLPSPLVINRSSKMKVGVKCVAGCEITGREIAIYDDAGTKLASAKLGTTPWSGTSGLYWAEVDLVAPGAEGTYCWTVRFMGKNSELPHPEASSSFSFIAVKPPEHGVTVKVLAKEAATALGDVEVRVGIYRGCTDEMGLARVDVPKGAYDLNVWKMGYESSSRSIEVNDDLTLCVEVIASPEPELEYWK